MCQSNAHDGGYCSTVHQLHGYCSCPCHDYDDDTCTLCGVAVPSDPSIWHDGGRICADCEVVLDDASSLVEASSLV